MQEKITVLKGRCCNVKEAASRNLEQMKKEGKETDNKIKNKYKSYSDLIV